MSNPCTITRRLGPARKWIVSIALLGLVLLGLVVIGLISEPGSTGPRSVVLPDGSTFELRETAYAKGLYKYQYRSGPAWVKHLSPVIPDFLERKLPGSSGGSFGFGGDRTSLILITVLEKATPRTPIRPERLRIRDGQGNAFDSNWGAHTLSMNRVLVNGWQLPAFPRRSPTLTAQFLGRDSQQKWVEIASFPVKNPAYTKAEDWIPEPLPVSKSDGELTIKLKRFLSGATAPGADPLNPLSPHLTQMEFEFDEKGEPVDHFNVQKVIVSDATGNRWHPYLNLLKPGGNNYARDGKVQFLGALWPGEPAWRIEVEAFRTAAFDPDHIWDVGFLSLPEARRHLALTNTFSIGDTKLQLANLLAPDVQVTNEWQWVVRYWGNESSVYSLGLHAPEGLGGRRVVVVDARNENGEAAELIEQRGWDQQRQALFFKIPDGSRRLYLKLALPELKRARFMVTPEYVETQEGAEG